MKYFFVIMISAVLSGCVTTDVRSNVVDQKTIEVVKVSEDLLLPCQLDAPPNIETYMAANRDAKEDMMVRYTLTLIEHSQNCSMDKKIIQETQIRQLKAAEEFNQKEKIRIDQLRKSLGEKP